jgi:hypothetical protein
MTCAVAELAPSQSSSDLLAAADEVLTALKVKRNEGAYSDAGDGSDQVRALGDRIIDG